MNNEESKLMREIGKIGQETSRDNANVGNNFSAKLLQIASLANKWYNLNNMPQRFADAHNNGDIHIHDADSYNLAINCLLIDLESALNKGFNTGYGTINKPKRIESAAELSCILLQGTQNDMFGGQGFTDFDNAMSEYLELTEQEEYDKMVNMIKSLNVGVGSIDVATIDDLVEASTEKRLRQAMQGVVFNLNTMHSRAGSQVPFSSLNIGLPEDEYAARVCRVFLEEYDKGLGKGEQPIFPNIIFRVKEGINANPEDPYYYLLELATKVAANRMNPTFLLCDSPGNIKWFNKGYKPSRMGCRTNIMKNINGEPGPDGRGNNFPVTINLPRIGIESKGDWNEFYIKLRNTMDLCKDQTMHRFNVAKTFKVKDLPFVAGEGLMRGSEKLKPNDSILPILEQGTIGIGFIGLAETLVAMMGSHHGESEYALAKGLSIIEFMDKVVKEYEEEEQLNFSLYATPKICWAFV